MINHILVPLDGSALAEDVLPHIEDLARRLRAEVYFVRAVALTPPPLAMEMLSEGDTNVGLLYDALDDEAKAAGDYLSGLTSGWRDKGITAASDVIRGDAASSIIEFARAHQIDLIAMSTHGRSGLSRLIFGSVAQQVVLEVGLPVMVVRPVEEAENLSDAPASRTRSESRGSTEVATGGKDQPDPVRVEERATMNIAINAEVSCADGARGRCTHVIVDPTTEQLTHLVVKENWPPSSVERLVPMDRVVETTPELIQLRCSGDELRAMDVFVVTHYLETTRPVYDYQVGGVYMLPYALPVEEKILVREEEERVPAGELAIHRGARVDATDKELGRADEFLIDPTSHRVTHLVLREGHLWGQKDVMIPVSAIARTEEDIIHLKLDAKSVEALPTIPVRRRPW